MESNIPYHHWQPLSLTQVADIFANAPFTWGLGGGYAVEQFLGTSIRAHGDIDVVVYRDEQLEAQRWLPDWCLYAADPPGTLRAWSANEYLPYGIHDIWGHRTDARAWQLQLMLVEVEEDEWWSRRDATIRGRRDDLIVVYNGMPCVRIEVQLLYKAKNLLPKDEWEFQACLPLLSADAKRWLKASLHRLYPKGHPWIHALS